MKPRVWLAVLHYQKPENTRECLKSLLALDYPSPEILVTDNCSPDGSLPLLCKQFPDLNFLALPTNLGFAGGANASIRYCIEHGADWIWLLNNDTVVSPDSLSLLMEAALVNERAALLGASVYTTNEKSVHRSGSGKIDFIKAKTFEKGLIDDSVQTMDCAWLSGCNLLIRAQAFEACGGFDEDFFLYFEDTDLCHRLKQAGWQCLLVPAARVDHEGGASTAGSLNIWRSYYYTRNRLLFFLKHRKGLATLPILFSVAIHLLRHCLVLPFRGKNGRRQLKAELLGLRDYCSGTFGKADCLDF